MSDRSQEFIDALHSLEQDRDIDTIAALFADGADIANPMVEHDGEGASGAAAFWSRYRDTFGTIESVFRTTGEAGDVDYLEWVSTGTIEDQPVKYGGVSVIEHGEGGITAFRTYFDPTPLRRSAH